MQKACLHLALDQNGRCKDVWKVHLPIHLSYENCGNFLFKWIIRNINFTQKQKTSTLKHLDFLYKIGMQLNKQLEIGNIWEIYAGGRGGQPKGPPPAMNQSSLWLESIPWMLVSRNCTSWLFHTDGRKKSFLQSQHSILEWRSLLQLRLHIRYKRL